MWIETAKPRYFAFDDVVLFMESKLRLREFAEHPKDPQAVNDRARN